MSAIWDQLHAMQADVAQRRIRSLFDDPARFDGFSARFDGILLDYSKTNIDAAIRAALIALADATGVPAARAAMFGGEPINRTEGRAVLHTALRAPADAEIAVDGRNVMPDVVATRSRMAHFATVLRSGAFKAQGGRVTDVVNIGIGGSDLGPAMATAALAPWHDGPRCHFVSNVDGAQIHDTLAGLDPETTVVIVASKTFTTVETMTNAATARDWMAQTVADPGAQFVALSSAQERAAAFGIAPERVFGFADWVGGRYSVWGPIGLSLMIAIGPDEFAAFLDGAASMDAHFRDAPPDENLPVLLALAGIWHRQICGYPTRAVLPYDQRLALLPAYLQQLEMESNGKRVGMDGADLTRPSGPVVWGAPGTNGQHAFFQLLHQGTDIVPCEFMVAAEGHEPDLAHHHALLVANCLAQSEALMTGRSLEEARALMAARGLEGAEAVMQARHRVFPGNRPSVTLAYDRLTPRRLGQIVALYEHRVFVEGVILGLNSFDQWGVELGKELATALGPVLSGEEPAGDKDGSTAGLVAFLRR
ncbi:glucose-6-phosphate isomerase [Lutimaribacter pacificus]|uniref:Glucose-6-phosphate isomerase n=1 Tax=Lutimaribacter pacificus TaxID=391948 RepID=A0A1H0AHL8_9RHOB|nr:glucose-6-phosphate isomerase [Lutimaribacter pacificus]SDN32276.1 glucose-6-phosphate isomerase [Lutimaribacter pacificus]SHJ69828.1 glucose-6-phosphate isomerase [Lutimaribacter pacificus]